MRHFWPELGAQLDALPDTRFAPMVTYHRRFLFWWGALLFCCKLGSRRQLDHQLRDMELEVLANLNRLSGCAQDSLPVNKTLSHFLGHVGPSALDCLRVELVRRLIRMRALDGARFKGSFVIAVDGTGFLRFRTCHCPHCLVRRRQGQAEIYLHPVLEAKLVDPRGLALSMASEFIENPEGWHGGPSGDPRDYARLKQDCELVAFERLAAPLKAHFAQLSLILSLDALYACGRVFERCRRNGWHFVVTFKPGRTPALWKEFQALLGLCAENRRSQSLADGTRQIYRWVNSIDYEDDEGRRFTLNALSCEEHTAKGERRFFAWLTDMPICFENVDSLANCAGRVRSKIENQGFNIQKNGGLNLEHAYSTHPEVLKAFYLLMQIAHLFLQMFEMGSLLQQLAREYSSRARQLFGGLKPITQRLLECLRYFPLSDEDIDPGRCQIRICNSS